MPKGVQLFHYLYRSSSSSSSPYIWNQGSSYLIHWQLGTWFQIYREHEDQGTVYVFSLLAGCQNLGSRWVNKYFIHFCEGNPIDIHYPLGTKV